MFSLKPEALASYQKVRKTKNPDIICHAPFSNINFEQGGNATACCYNRKHVLGKFPEQNIKEMWFGEKAEELRNYIKDENFNMGCELCAQQINSFNFENSRLKGFDDYATEPNWKNNLKQKLKLKSATYPKCFEFEIDNICNLECVMCDGKFSSLIRQNRENLPPIVSPYNDSFVEEVAHYIPYLQEAKFLGGEPFLTPLYYKIWDKIIELNPGLSISITTNATVLTKKVKQVLTSLNARIILSIDSVNKETYELIRQNANFEKVMENIQYFLKYSNENNRPISLAVCPITLNYLEVPEIVDFCNNNNARIFFNTVDRPYRFSLKALDLKELQQAKQSYFTYLNHPKSTFIFNNKRAIEDLYNYVSDLVEKAEHKREIESKERKFLNLFLEEINHQKRSSILKRLFSIYIEIQGLRYANLSNSEFQEFTNRLKQLLNEFIIQNGFEKTLNLFDEILIMGFKLDKSLTKGEDEIRESLFSLKIFVKSKKEHSSPIIWRIFNIKTLDILNGIEHTSKDQIVGLLEKEFFQ